MTSGRRKRRTASWVLSLVEHGELNGDVRADYCVVAYLVHGYRCRIYHRAPSVQARFPGIITRAKAYHTKTAAQDRPQSKVNLMDNRTGWKSLAPSQLPGAHCVSRQRIPCVARLPLTSIITQHRASESSTRLWVLLCPIQTKHNIIYSSYLSMNTRALPQSRAWTDLSPERCCSSVIPRRSAR